MEKDEFSKLKLAFVQADVEEKIALYTKTPGLTVTQYKELLRVFPYERMKELEAALE